MHMFMHCLCIHGVHLSCTELNCASFFLLIYLLKTEILIQKEKKRKLFPQFHLIHQN